MAYTTAEINHSQFYRYETYGRAAQKPKDEQKSAKGGKTMYDIIGEATRQEGYTEHLEKPEEPVLLYGIPYSEALKLAEKWCEETKEIRHDKKKKKIFNELTETEEEVIEIVERKTALKKTAQCCIAGVVSAPPDMTEDDWTSFRDDSIEYLKKKYGDRLKTVVEHLDENYQTENFKDVLHHHIHYFVVPEIGEKIEDIHPGLKAKYEADYLRGNREASSKATKEEKKLSRQTGDKAYREAMRKEQDAFYDAVSYKYNLNRKGKKRCEHFNRQSFLDWNQERNVDARRRNELETEKKIVEQEKNDAKEILKREASVKEKEKEIDLFEDAKKVAEDTLKNIVSETPIKSLSPIEEYKNLGSPDILAENFPVEKTGFLSQESHYEYADRMIKKVWNFFSQKIYEPLKKRCNKLMDALKTLKRENSNLKYELDKYKKANERLENSTQEVVKERVSEKIKDEKETWKEEGRQEVLKEHKKALQFFDHFINNKEIGILRNDGTSFPLLHGKQSIINMDKELTCFENLTPTGFRKLADKMDKLKIENGYNAYEKMEKDGCKSLGEWLEKKTRNQGYSGISM
ncbi:MAG: hypothetical protein K5640_05960 [Treponema sp.]|nr:hypothetical protein [Treponema sp.]